MKRCLLAAAVALAWVAAAVGPRAEAQFTYQRPQTNPYGGNPVSPYLNLTRGGNPAINYYGLVRPELDSLQMMQTLGQQGYAPLPLATQTGTLGAAGRKIGRAHV